MSCTAFAGTRFMPLLSRVVLGVAFFFSGWHLCFQEVTFTTEQIKRLEGVTAVAVPAALIQEGDGDQGDKADPPAAEPAETAEKASAKPIAPIGPFTPKAETPPADEGLLRPAAARLTLGLRDAGFEGWSEPVAWGAAVVQLLGGALIFVGLLTRVWAFLMAIMLGASFWFISVQSAAMFDLNPFDWAADGAAFQGMFFTLAMFVLAFGVLLTGPGMLAVDTLLWPGKAASPPAEPAE